MKCTSRDNRSSLATTIGALSFFGCFQGRCELRAAVECIGTLAGFGLDELMRDVHGFARCEVLDNFALGLQTEAGTALGLGRNPIIGNDRRGHGHGHPHNVLTSVNML